MADLRDLRVWTLERRFGVFLPRERLSDILEFCRKAGLRETGGILFGRYTEARDLAVVQHVTGPPSDSAAGRTWFDRGVAGLQDLIFKRWRCERDYYLGEWHYHPGGAPHPSSTDEAQMKGYASDPKYRCPEPILLILGGDPQGEWRLSVRVYPRGQEPLEMTEQDRPTSS